MGLGFEILRNLRVCVRTSSKTFASNFERENFCNETTPKLRACERISSKSLIRLGAWNFSLKQTTVTLVRSRFYEQCRPAIRVTFITLISSAILLSVTIKTIVELLIY